MSAAAETAAQVTGALDCLRAVRAARKIAAGNSSQTTEQYFQRRDAAAAEILRAVGGLQPQAAGAVALLVELLVEEFSNGYSASESLDNGMRFESAMTGEEKAMARAELIHA